MSGEQALVTIRPDDSGRERQLSLEEVRKVIRDYLDAADFGLAASIATQLADQLPREPWPQLIAAETLYLGQQTTAAFHYIDRALELDPDSIASLVVKARLCVYSGDSVQANRQIDRAVGLAPEDPRLLSVKAELLVDLGDIDGARECYLKAVGINPRNTDGLLGLSQLPGDNFSDDLIKMVEFIIQSRQVPAEEQTKAHFALAHAYDKKGDLARHFAHVNAGNELKNQSLRYDPDTSRREAQAIVDFFSESFFDRHASGAGNPAEIIFVVGFPRCGSTLVEQILASHPSVASAGEVYALRHAIQEFQQSRAALPAYPLWLEDPPVGALTEIADNYLRRVRPFNRRARLTDKMLDNYRFVGLIHLAFPNARIVNVQRDPIDVCYSCYKRVFNLAALPFAYDLGNLAGKYRDYRRIIRHWNRVLPGKIHTVQYEQLVARQEDVTRALLDHCGLPWDDACMQFHEAERAVQTSSNIQVRQPLYADSVERWKGREEYLGPLLDLLEPEVDERG